MTDLSGPYGAGAPDPDEPGINRVLQKAALRFNRRGFIGRAGAASFGMLAGFSVGTASATVEPPCTGPFNTGACRSASLCFCTSKPCGDLCRTYSCQNVSESFCHGAPEASYCWEWEGNTCCDCQCSSRDQTQSFYCYCNYRS